MTSANVRQGRLVRWTLAWLSLCPVLGATPAQVPWAEIPQPMTEHSVLWDAPMLINGKSAHLRGLQVRADAAELEAFYRQRLGVQALTQELLGQRTMTTVWHGQAVTVGLRDLGAGEVEVTLLQSEFPNSDAPLRRGGGNTAGDLSWLPAGSALLCQLSVRDGSAGVRVLAGANTVSVQANGEHAARVLQEQGFVLTGVPTTDDAGGWVLHGERPGAQAVLTVADEGRYRSLVLWQRSEVAP